MGEIAALFGLLMLFFLVYFNKTNLTKRFESGLTIFTGVVLSLCLMGLAAYIVQVDLVGESRQIGKVVVPDTVKSFNIRFACGDVPPDENSSLGALFKYAEKNEGEIIEATIVAANCKCPDENPLRRERPNLQSSCPSNPLWWAAKLDLSCVNGHFLAGNSTGIASFCFPKPENLPLIKGYKRDFKAVEVTISGKFIIDYTFAVGAEHVILAIPER